MAEERKLPNGKTLPKTETINKSFKTRKRVVYNLEKSNRQYLYLYKREDEYWEVGGVSALVYYYKLCPKLKKIVELRTDEDVHSIFTFGVVAVKNEHAFKNNMKKLGLTIEERPELGTYVIVAKLPVAISNDDVRVLKNIDKEREKNVEKAMRIKNPVPELDGELRTLTERLGHMFAKKDKIFRDTLGKELLESAIKMRMLYFEAAKTSSEEVAKDKFMEIFREADRAMELTKIAADVKAITTPGMSDIYRILMLVERMSLAKHKDLKGDYSAAGK